MLRENTTKLEDESELRKQAKVESEEIYYSRTEVIELINKFSYENCDDAYQNNDKWIEENIK